MCKIDCKSNIACRRVLTSRGAEHFRKIAARLSDGAGAHPQAVHYAEDGWAGGVYLWKARADAEAFYSGPWLAGIRERYGIDPQIKYFHTPCVTDNSVDAVLLPDPE